MITSEARHGRPAFECVPNECGIADFTLQLVAGCLDDLAVSDFVKLRIGGLYSDPGADQPQSRLPMAQIVSRVPCCRTAGILQWRSHPQTCSKIMLCVLCFCPDPQTLFCLSLL